MCRRYLGTVYSVPFVKVGVITSIVTLQWREKIDSEQTTTARRHDDILLDSGKGRCYNNKFILTSLASSIIIEKDKQGKGDYW